MVHGYLNGMALADAKLSASEGEVPAYVVGQVERDGHASSIAKGPARCEQGHGRGMGSKA